MKTAVITVGLGFGDESKGAAVDHLCRRLGADMVVRYSGGSQCGHNVVEPFSERGRAHTFSQFGAGTLAGARTHLGADVIIDPPALEREADHLVRLEAIEADKPYASLTVHPDALVTTAFHRALNRAKELNRGTQRHGSCGSGIGETRRYAIECGEHAIRAADLSDLRTLTAKLTRLKRWVLNQDQACAFNLISMQEAFRLGNPDCPIPLSREIPACETAIFEGAQGVLLDEHVGFHPHTTWSDVTQRNARELAQQSGAERVVALGLTRAFTTRHGAGPLPTYDPGLTRRLHDSGNPENPWQGAMRSGWLDLPLLHYAAEHCGGPLDGLIVSWLDKFQYRERICIRYQGTDPLESLKPTQAAAGSEERLREQEALGQALSSVVPAYTYVDEDRLLDRLSGIAPIIVTSFGPTYVDRIAGGALERLVGERANAQFSPRDVKVYEHDGEPD